MFVFDGKEVRLKCQKCGHKFRYVVGTGPCCPTNYLVNKNLRENPPACPKCGSRNVKRVYGLLDVFGF